MISNPQHKIVNGMGIISALVPTVVAAIALIIGNLLILDYIHVLLGAIWTGVDVFFGVIFRLIFRELSPETRAAVAYRVIPVTLFFLPVASILTPLLGYSLAIHEKIWSLYSNIFIWITIVGILLIASGFATVLLNSLLVARSRVTDDSYIRKRFAWICNGALLQLAFQVAIISLMANLVVFH